MKQSDTLLIIDYNLSRITEVAHMVEYARARYGLRTLLIRANPSAQDDAICDEVIDLDPLHPDFVDRALVLLKHLHPSLRGGIVFSDNAVHSGAQLLERLNLKVDNAALALGAFSKHAYRQSEAAFAHVLQSQRVLAPDCERIDSIKGLQAFADSHPDGFVVKPSCEGNNRGVVVVQKGDDLRAAYDEVSAYVDRGVICEQFIPYEREYSYDGIGSLSFITEKLSATGRYPVEIAQVLPAHVNAREQATLLRTGHLCNLLVGQHSGPFHNEIKLSDDGTQAAVVEPNRRPGGMKIWWLAEAVYGVDLYRAWIDSVAGDPAPVALPSAKRQAATVMLGIPEDGVFTPASLDGPALFSRVLAVTALQHGLRSSTLCLGEFGWLGQEPRHVRAVPRDNADFVAQVTVVLDSQEVDIRPVVLTLRAQWLALLADALEKVKTASPASTRTTELSFSVAF